MGQTPMERRKYIDELKAYAEERRARESGHQHPKQADAENVTDLSPEHVDEKAQGELKTSKCEYHPEVDAVGGCIRCQRFICAECQATCEGKLYCKTCYSEVFGNNGAPPNASVWKPRIDLSSPKIIAAGLGVFVVGLLIVVLNLGSGQTAQQATQPQPYVSTYTADQVIDVAKANFPVPDIPNKPKPMVSWTTRYLGRGKWEVTVEGYRFKEQWWFYESTGTLSYRNQ